MFSCCCEDDPGEVRRPTNGRPLPQFARNNLAKDASDRRKQNSQTPPRNFALDHHAMTAKQSSNNENDDDDDEEDENEISHGSSSSPEQKEKLRRDREKKRKIAKEKAGKNKNCLALLCCGGSDFDYAAELERRKKRQEIREQELMARMQGPRQELSPNDRSLLTRCRNILASNGNSLKIRECIKILIGTKGGRALLFRRYLEKTLAGFQMIRQALSEKKYLIAADTCRKIKYNVEQDGTVFELRFHDNHDDYDFSDEDNNDGVNNDGSKRKKEKEENSQIIKILNLFEVQSYLGMGRFSDAINVSCDLLTTLEHHEDAVGTLRPDEIAALPGAAAASVLAITSGNKNTTKLAITNNNNNQNPLAGNNNNNPKAVSAFSMPTNNSNINRNNSSTSTTSNNSKNSLSSAISKTSKLVSNLVARSSVYYLRSRAKALQASSLLSQYKEDMKLQQQPGNTSPRSNNNLDQRGAARSVSPQPQQQQSHNVDLLPSLQQMTADSFSRLENAVADANKCVGYLTQAYTLNRVLRVQQQQTYAMSRTSVFESEELNSNIEFFFVFKFQHALVMLAEFEKRLLFRDWQDIRQTILTDFLDEQMDLEDKVYEQRMKNIKEAIARRHKRAEDAEEAVREEEMKRKAEEEAEEARKAKRQEQERQRFNKQQQSKQRKQQQQQGFGASGFGASSGFAPSTLSPFEVKQQESFEVLELNTNFTAKTLTEDDLKHSYRKLSLKWHPDRWSGVADASKRSEAEEKMKKINEANEFLREHVLML